MHILVVDDERQITRVLRTSLQSSGYEVSTASNGVEALKAFQEQKPHLVITDLAMPEMDGLELTRALRRESEVPIIVLSVRDQEPMKVAALDAGADDYMTKPFGISELQARIRAMLRRTKPEQQQPMQIDAGDFQINVDAHAVCVRGEAVHLTPKEFDLLVLFARSPYRVLTHKTLLRAIWGSAGEDQPEYLRVLVAQLRKKIELPDVEGGRYVRSEPWVGYRFHPDGKDEVIGFSGEHL